MTDKKKYKIVVASDSHGNVRALESLLPVINQSDTFVYLGDGNRDIDRIEDKITAPVIRVRGNCDAILSEQDEATFTVGNTRFLAAHGNAYGVKSSRLSFADRARQTGCVFALYGHTHRADITDAGGVTLINPGTLARGYQKSYAVIEGDGDFFSAEIVRL